MPNATFTADFNQFVDETKKANTALAVFQDQSAQASTGVTKLQSAAITTAPEFTRLHGSLQQFDSLLATMGVHIGPEIRGLAELSSAAGKSASDIGLIATAGLALGAGIGGWKIGRLVADFFDLDKAVSQAWTTILGFGDVEKETAGANADILSLATIRAGHAVTDMAEAIKVNKTWMDEWNLSHHKTTDAVGDSAKAVADWRGQIDRVKSEGNFEQLTADLNSQNFSLEALSKKYGVHIEALQFLTRATKNADDAIKAIDETILKRWRDEAEGAKIMEDVEIKLHKGFLDRAKAETDAARTRAAEINSVTVEGALAIRKVQEDAADAIAKTTLSSTDYQVKEIWRVVTEQERAFKGSLEQRAVYNKTVEDMAQKTADALIAKELTVVVGHGPTAPNAGAGRVSGNLAGTVVPADILAAVAGMSSTSASLEVARMMKLRGLSFQEGGRVPQTGLIYAHKGEYVEPVGGSRGMTIQQYIYITQPLATEDAIARAVGDSTVQRLKNIGKRFPTGA